MTETMKVRVDFEISNDVRRGIRAMVGKKGLANKSEVRAEIAALWGAHEDDLTEAADSTVDNSMPGKSHE